MENIDVVYIEGDGVGKEITPKMIEVVDSAVKKCYKTNKQITWHKALASTEAIEKYGVNLPDSTLDLIKKYKLCIKGPLTTPVGKGARSINVALRQALDLYVCLRPVEYFDGVPTPVLHPEKVDMVVFRENTEDIYAGVEWEEGSDEVKKVIEFLQNNMAVKKIRFPETSAIGIKPISKEGSRRIIKAAFDYAIEHKRKSVTIVHKGNIMKFTEGFFRQIGYDLALNEYKGIEENGKKYIFGNNNEKIEVKDCICDAFLQNILLKPEEYDVIVTMNLNGDYISDALAAQVGGIGIAPGANINYKTGMAVFEATHGTAPDIAGKDIVNPLSIIFSACMMLEYKGMQEASDIIKKASKKLIKQRCVTKDFYNSLKKIGQSGTLLSTSEFTKKLLENL